MRCIFRRGCGKFSVWWCTEIEVWECRWRGVISNRILHNLQFKLIITQFSLNTRRLVANHIQHDEFLRSYYFKYHKTQNSLCIWNSELKLVIFNNSQYWWIYFRSCCWNISDKLIQIVATKQLNQYFKILYFHDHKGLLIEFYRW